MKVLISIGFAVIQKYLWLRSRVPMTPRLSVAVHQRFSPVSWHFYPGCSLVHAIGNEGSGTHYGTTTALDVELSHADMP